MSRDVIPPQIEEDFPAQTKELNHDPGFLPSLHAGLIYSPSDLLPDKGRPCISVRISARHLYLLSTYAPIAHLRKTSPRRLQHIWEAEACEAAKANDH